MYRFFVIPNYGHKSRKQKARSLPEKVLGQNISCPAGNATCG
jgi:hypothetical protein